MNESRLLKLQSPIYVFGDFHGYLTDLLAFAKILWPLVCTEKHASRQDLLVER